MPSNYCHFVTHLTCGNQRAAFVPICFSHCIFVLTKERTSISGLRNFSGLTVFTHLDTGSSLESAQCKSLGQRPRLRVLKKANERYFVRRLFQGRCPWLFQSHAFSLKNYQLLSRHVTEPRAVASRIRNQRTRKVKVGNRFTW